jgi:hypothetical protein
MPRPIRVVPSPTATVAFRDVFRLIIAVLVIGMILGAAAWTHMSSAGPPSHRGPGKSPTPPAPTNTRPVRALRSAGHCPAGPWVDRMAAIPGGRNAAASAKRTVAAQMSAVHTTGKRVEYAASKRVCRSIVDDVNTTMYPYIVVVGPFRTERDAVRFCETMGYAPTVNHYRDCLPKPTSSRYAKQ